MKRKMYFESAFDKMDYSLQNIKWWVLIMLFKEYNYSYYECLEIISIKMFIINLVNPNIKSSYI